MVVPVRSGGGGAWRCLCGVSVVHGGGGGGSATQCALSAAVAVGIAWWYCDTLPYLKCTENGACTVIGKCLLFVQRCTSREVPLMF